MNTPTTIPTHHVFVMDGEGTNAFWIKTGAAWHHGDGKGLNLPLDVLVVFHGQQQ
ncbi:hypothetical protein [Agrobacterium radiobacter]|uniref:hypothetical protein n=1 Tax=Agrobacterium radiobacter TaxID=362 RepID=UPI003F863289